MSEEQMIVETLLQKALDDWTDGTEPQLFPVNPDDPKTPVNMIWTMALNAMAYGLEVGIEQGYQLAKAEDGK